MESTFFIAGGFFDIIKLHFLIIKLMISSAGLRGVQVNLKSSHFPPLNHIPKVFESLKWNEDG